MVADGLNRCPVASEEVWACKWPPKTIRWSTASMEAQSHEENTVGWRESQVFEAMTALCHVKESC